MEKVNKEPWEDFPSSPDLEITVGNLKINCHKLILAFKSPVFRSMFEVKMVENTTNKLTIEDIDEETFLIFLKYLYVPEQKISIENLSMDLLNAANKYMVRSLLEIFNDHSEAFVNVENAIECAIVASQNESSWRAKLLNFIADNYELIRKRETFQLLKREIDLMIALFDKLSLDPERGLSRCQNDDAQISYSTYKPQFITTERGWNLMLSTGYDHIVLDINKNQFDERYFYFVNLKVEAFLCSYRKQAFSDTIHESSFPFKGEVIRKDIMPKNESKKYESTFQFKIQYWKLEV